MTTLSFPMVSPNALKRTFAETGLEASTPSQEFPLTFQATVTPCSAAITHENANSPRVSQAPLNNQVSSSHCTPDGTARDIAVATSGESIVITQPPAKRAKLTFAEKEARRFEKEWKDGQKAEEKARKEEEKAQRDAKREEERQCKEAEKQEKLRAREEVKKSKLEEQLLKEEERRRREGEKVKKAQSQLRINSFFPLPLGAHSARNESPIHDGPSPPNSRRSSISGISATEGTRRSRSLSTTPRKTIVPDYDRSFPPFYVKVHTILAPSNRFSRDTESHSAAHKSIDMILQTDHSDESNGPSTVFNYYQLFGVSPHDSRRRTSQLCSIKDIVAEIDAAARTSIDLTESPVLIATKKPLELLKTIPLKHLKFIEDVRPPYTGTYTRLRDRQAVAKLARNPFRRILPGTNYDYDSEAEWEEPGEGEDLDSEAEEEADDEDEAEMNDFLDDAEATDVRALKRRPLMGDLEPTCSGLCWEGPQSKSPGLDILDLPNLRLDVLMDGAKLPIDPYTTSYWDPSISQSSQHALPSLYGESMAPPRVPLQPMPRHNANYSSLSKENSIDPSGKMKPLRGPKRFLPPELMDQFKASVNGNDLTKVGILEILKKQFPAQPKDAIKETLDLVAERVGPNSREKTWRLKSGW